VDKRRLIILADGWLEFHHGKTAVSLLRYRPEDVVAVIDREHAGATTGDALGVGGEIPVVAEVSEALPLGPTALLIGVAPLGGGLAPEWREQILTAIRARLDIISGLHYMLNEDAQFVGAARSSGVQLVDVRQPPPGLGVSTFRDRRPGSHVITFVGSDCAVGKMTAALEIRRAAEALGLRSAFVATGQTGIMLEGSGIAVDRVIGDFMAGAVEQMVVEAASVADWVFVEGQGSLLHPAYSGVTLSLLHGSAPDGMILVHQPSLTAIDSYPVAIPRLTRLVSIYEDAAGWIKPAPVVAIALNTRDLDEGETKRAIERAEEETGLPAADPIKGGARKLAEATWRALEGRSHRRESTEGVERRHGVGPASDDSRAMRGLSE
jgi:uncharacterized NAD-dependent epimerase/dehydratase family protein